MSKWILSLASVAMLALAMSGCGGSDGSSQVDGDAGGTPPPAVNPPALKSVMNEPEAVGSLPQIPMIPSDE